MMSNKCQFISACFLIFILFDFTACRDYLSDDDKAGKRLFTNLLTKSNIDGLVDSVYVGYFDVFENRTKKDKTIKIFVMVMPSYDQNNILSPIFHLEGGPGAGAATAAPYYEEFREFRRNRDVVLIDFRGTGKSSGLYCKSMLFSSDNPQDAFDDMFPIEKVKACYNELKEAVDLTQYSTSNAITDLEEIRGWLGYDKINLLSYSYGTRACQSYLRQYPESIRSAIMFGASPTFSHRPESFARDAQEALDLVLVDCQNDSLCSVKYPNLKLKFETILNRIQSQPFQYTYLDPLTKQANQLTISRGILAEIIRTITYSVEGQRKLPSIIDRAFEGDFRPIVEMAIRRSEGYNDISDAFYLCVTCSEDVPFIDTTKIYESTTGTFLGDYRIQQELRACKYWPSYAVELNYLEPLKSDIPVLLLSGDHDPVTPPRWGWAMSQNLNNYRHIIVPYLSHAETGMSNLQCLSQGFSNFYDKPSSQFEMECIKKVKPIPFF